MGFIVMYDNATVIDMSLYHFESFGLKMML